jgi:glycosyltransferase involved in cell wall biosynthesis
MKLAVYHPQIKEKGGSERVVLEILEKSKHDTTLFTNNFEPEETYSEFREHEIIEKKGLPVKGELLKGAASVLNALFTKIPEKKYDALVVSTWGISEFINYRNRSIPLIGYCHTPLRAVYDQKVKKHTLEESSFLKRQLYRTASLAFKIIDKPSWKLFDHVIFNSETTRNRAKNNKLVKQQQTSVIHPGADTQGNKGGEYQEYFFYPSRFVYYKRQNYALEAYRRFKEKNPETDHKLILAGQADEESEYFQEIKEKADQVEGVEIKTNVPGEEWEELYQNCYSVLFTAINEDWGIIPIEAGSYKKPIISVNEGGPTESIVNGETGFLVNSEEEMAKKMEELVKDKEKVEEIGRKARERSQKYTWNKFIDEFDQEVEGEK